MNNAVFQHTNIVAVLGHFYEITGYRKNNDAMPLSYNIRQSLKPFGITSASKYFFALMSFCQFPYSVMPKGQSCDKNISSGSFTCMSLRTS